jgi:hypothetical protein
MIHVADARRRGFPPLPRNKKAKMDKHCRDAPCFAKDRSCVRFLTLVRNWTLAALIAGLACTRIVSLMPVGARRNILTLCHVNHRVARLAVEISRLSRYLACMCRHDDLPPSHWNQQPESSGLDCAEMRRTLPRRTSARSVLPNFPAVARTAQISGCAKPHSSTFSCSSGQMLSAPSAIG